MPLKRLLGQETEYAIRYSPEPDGTHPGNLTIYRAIRRAMESIVETRDGERKAHNDQFFLENGGAFTYEHQPYDLKGGLVEGATPECQSPMELLTYQRAQELLLLKSLPLAKGNLAFQGYWGDLALIKNCRDANGNIYGAQENYQANIASGAGFVVFGISAFVCLPLMLIFYLAYLPAFAILLLAVISLLFIFFAGHWLIKKLLASLGFILRWQRFRNLTKRFSNFGKNKRKEFFDFLDDEQRLTAVLCRLDYKISFPFINLMFLPHLVILRIVAFKKYRKILNAFIASRVIISGAGCVLENGDFALSEKGSAIKREVRRTVGAHERPLYDSGNLLKAVILGVPSLFRLRFRKVLPILRRSQRLQLGLSDSNRAEIAEYLKIGTTYLIMEMIEQGFIKDAPEFKNSVEALKVFTFDPSLTHAAKTRTGESLSALQVQRWFLEQAKNYLKQSKTTHVELLEITRLWEETLHLLEYDPKQLIGRLDWISKRYLLETAGKGASFAVKKKIDIGYHELGSGYFDVLEKNGLSLTITSEEAVEDAMTQPSTAKSAQLRSRLIKSLAFKGKSVSVSWSSVKVGGLLRNKVIFLDDARRRRSP